MKQTELIVSRHGETEENIKHIMQGQLPGHLSALGLQQAEQLADRMEHEPLDVIVCSDLARSYDTAQIVARRKGMQPIATLLLREMDWGKYTGTIADEADFTNMPDSDAESTEALYLRAKDFLQFLKDKFSGKRILIIGHGAFNRAIIARLENRPKEEIPTLRIMRNTECLTYTL